MKRIAYVTAALLAASPVYAASQLMTLTEPALACQEVTEVTQIMTARALGVSSEVLLDLAKKYDCVALEPGTKLQVAMPLGKIADADLHMVSGKNGLFFVITHHKLGDFQAR